MTTPPSPASRRARTLLWVLSAACLAGSATVGIVGSALGVAVGWPIWLLLVANGVGLVGGLAGPRRPAVQQYFLVAAAVLSILAVVGLVVRRP